MPIYTFRDTTDGEIFDVLLSLSDYDEYKLQHPHHERFIDQAPSIVSSVAITGKLDDGFKDVMTKITEAHPNSPLAENHGRKSIKQIQSQRAIQKWRSAGK